MNTVEVTVVRIYLNEKAAHLDKLLRRLHDEEQVRGVTVFRGVSGFGGSGQLHTARLMDLSLNLPVVVEFFDIPDKVAPILEHLDATVKPGHMVHWNARVNEHE